MPLKLTHMPPSKKKGGKAPKEPAADGAPVSAASAPARARSSLAEFEEWMTKAGITWDTSVISLRAGDGDAAGKAQPATPEAPWAVYAGVCLCSCEPLLRRAARAPNAYRQ